MKYVCLFLCAISIGCQAPDESSKVIVSGRVLGQDGKPMAKARILPPEEGKLDVNPDGTFSFQLLRTGAAHLWFLGPAHNSIAFPIYSDSVDHIELDIILESAMDESGSGPLFVTGSFNDFSSTEDLVPMQKDENGVFSVVMHSPADTFAYQLVGLESTGEIAMASPNADYVAKQGRYVGSDYPGAYASVLYSPDDSVLIEFKPEDRIRKTAEPIVRFIDPESRSAKMYRYKKMIPELTADFSTALRAHNAAGLNEGFSFDDSTMKAEFRALIDEEEDDVIKNFLRLEYFGTGNPQIADSTIVADLLASLSPESSLWAAVPFENTLQRMTHYTNDKASVKAYQKSMMERHSRARVRSSLLAQAVRFAHFDMEEERKNIDLGQEVNNSAAIKFSELYDRLITEYPESHDAKRTIKRYASDRKIQVGNKAPEFTIGSIEIKDLQLGTTYFKDKVWLIDFWAESCGPCIGEMKYLHAAYGEFKNDGLEILSLSFDEPTSINELRERRWPMPWHHASLEDGFYSEIAKKYDLVAIPRKVLVDGDGVIIALDGELRGEKLAQTLQVYFEQKRI